MNITLINNKFIKEKDAKISIYSDAFMRGYGVFETLRTYGNKQLLQEKQHIKRLLNSAKKIELKIRYSQTQILQMLKKTIKKSPFKLQRLKIIAIPEGLIITSIPLEINSKIYNGVSCMAVECVRSLPEIKSISYLPSFLSHEKAIKEGFFEAILIDKNQEIYEGAYSNIFWFEKNQLCTRENSILQGITRDTILKISPFKTKFKNIKLKNLLKTDEIFLTSSINGILPVIKINKKIIGNGKQGERTKILMEKFIKQLPS